MNKIIPDQWHKDGKESPLATFVKNIHPVSPEAIEYINQHSYPQRVDRGTFLLKAGEVSRHLYFIRRGVIRAYIKDGTKEITTWITAENEVVASIRGFNLQQPSMENLQAIEECDLVVADFESLQYLYTHHMEMNIVGRKLLEHYYRDAEERAFISRIPNATKRYHHFLNTQGHLSNRIPLKYIASYLGMTIETMSRIRSARPKVK
ncbi:MAG: Crp/Fnr family transcriptional regulator [Chitinophagaceae bacterium]|nr:Crp/Fnr family transcriptional regulator [Chitinophagaceae bacterium]